MSRPRSTSILNPRPRWGAIAAGLTLGLAAGLIQILDERDSAFVLFVSFVLAGWGAALVAAFGFKNEGLNRGRAITFLAGTLYAIWGYPCGVVGWVYASALLSSLVWAAALTRQFGYHAWLPMIVLGGLTSLLGHAVLTKSALITDWLGVSTMIWHLGHPTAIYFAARGRLHHEFGHIVNNTCPICGFSLEGLGRTKCPECGIRLNKLDGEPLEIDLRGYHEA